MPKLLSQKELNYIATKMTEAYGLPPPNIIDDDYYATAKWGVKVEIFRSAKTTPFRWFKWLRKKSLVKVKDYYADSFEGALQQLQIELTKFDGRAKVAEQFREKYALEEADVVIEHILKNGR